jgi:hypothetical protein
MTLQELRDNILYDRGSSTADDDRLWSNATLVRYINEAQRRFAKRSLIIRDASTPAVVEVTLQDGVDTYALHESILSVISAKIDGKAVDLVRIGHSVFGSSRTAPTRHWRLTPTKR